MFLKKKKKMKNETKMKNVKKSKNAGEEITTPHVRVECITHAHTTCHLNVQTVFFLVLI